MFKYHYFKYALKFVSGGKINCGSPVLQQARPHVLLLDSCLKPEKRANEKPNEAQMELWKPLNTIADQRRYSDSHYYSTYHLIPVYTEHASPSSCSFAISSVSIFSAFCSSDLPGQWKRPCVARVGFGTSENITFPSCSLVCDILISLLRARQSPNRIKSHVSKSQAY